MDKIQSTGNNYGMPFQPQRNQESQNPNIEEMIQRLSMMNSQTQQGLGMDSSLGLQGSSQDAMVSFSPEAQSIQAAQSQGVQQKHPGEALHEQLESQISGGDLEGAQATLELLADAPDDPALVSQLKSDLENGDAQGAQEIMEQIKANRPPAGPPPAQQ